jgi:hypothetical protein
VIRVLLSERIQKTARGLSQEIRLKTARTISTVSGAFGDPHRHRGLGLRKLAARSYEVRIHLQWRVVFLHDGSDLIAYDIMNHDQVARWLRGQRKA